MPTNKQQREAARRHLQHQLERRREAEARRRKALIGITVVATVAVIGVVLGLVIGLSGSSSTKAAAGSSSTSASSASTSAAAAGATTGPCRYTPAASNPNLKDVGLPPDPNPTPTTARTLTFASNLGTITVDMDAAGAPCNVQSIAYLAQKGFYNGTGCPRTVNSGIFVVQCGDPSGTTAGGPSYTTKDENLANAKYTAGAVAMANSGANTNGSQFFFITADSQLGQNYTVIGHVTAGLDVLQSVVAAGNDGSNSAGGGKPKKALTFTTVTVAPPLDLSSASASPPASGSASGSASPSGTASAPASVTTGTPGTAHGSPISS